MAAATASAKPAARVLLERPASKRRFVPDFCPSGAGYPRALGRNAFEVSLAARLTKTLDLDGVFAGGLSHRARVTRGIRVCLAIANPIRIQESFRNRSPDHRI